ncbi:MAG: glycogen synthase GlgA [Nitrospirae bacterium]|jgi:starch synthase|nr:glycogen synthase GlgA [Nitrospirota bacterium]
MRILIATSEAVPYAKTGGLADVTGVMCREYRKMGMDAHLVMPLYKKIKDGRFRLKDTEIRINVPVGGRKIKGSIFTDEYANYFIECDEFFDREELYGTPEGDYTDNASRFVFFSRGILETCRALNFNPDIIHCNDWQTGLVPLYLKTLYKTDKFFKNTATLLTIHNLGYQGIFPVSEILFTNLGWELFNPEGIEFYGKINFLKAGIISADVLNTVSYTYSREILTKEFGSGLEGVLKTRIDDLYGIINGIDYQEWDPLQDKFIPANYNKNDLTGKTICKIELLKSLFKTSKKEDALHIPLIGIVGRLAEQKGLDLVTDSIDELMSFGVRLVILGKGEEVFHRNFLEIAKKYKRLVSVTIGFDEQLAHRIYAGSDLFLMPSRYEPCGLGQLISLRYATIPVARKTGGPADTIQDYNPLLLKGTGFLFSDYTPSAMMDALKRAFCVYTDMQKMKKIIINGMKKDFSWKKSAEKYVEIYKLAIKNKKINKNKLMPWT